MATTRSSQSPVVYGWGDCQNNKLSNGIVQQNDGASTGSVSAIPPIWPRPKKLPQLSSSTISKSGDDRSDDSKSGVAIAHSVACGAHNSAVLAIGGPFGSAGALLIAGAGLSAHGTSLLGDASHKPSVKPNNTDEKTGSETSTVMAHSPLTGPVQIPRSGALTTQTVTQVALGNYHAALVTRHGHAYTWGWGALGQLGHGDNNSKSEPTHVLSLFSVSQVACGTKFTAAVSLFGELYTFGENDQGQLGIGNCQRQFSPVHVKHLSNYTVMQVDCGASHMAAVTTPISRHQYTDNFPSGRDDQSKFSFSKESSPKSYTGCAGVISCVWTWGQSSSSGKIETLPKEVTVLSKLGITHIACGEFHTLALSAIGQVFEWKLGEIPVFVSGLQGHVIRSIDTGAFHNLALTTSGRVFSWGRSKTGQLGRPAGDTGSDQSKPGLISMERKTLDRSVTESSTTQPSSSSLSGHASVGRPSGRNPSPKAKGSHASLSLSNDSNLSPKVFISRISAGEYHNLAIAERDPRRLLLWKIYKVEREYLVKLHVLVDMYMKCLSRLSEDVSSFDVLQIPNSQGTGTIPDWTSWLSDSGVVGTPSALTTSGSHWYNAYKQQLQKSSQSSISDWTDPVRTLRGLATSPSRSELDSPVSKESGSSSGSSLPGMSIPINLIQTTSPGPGSPSKNSLTGSGDTNITEGFKSLLSSLTFKQIVSIIFSNIDVIYNSHSQFVLELGKKIEASHHLGADARSVVDSIMSFWLFRLELFSNYAYYADHYTEAAYHLFMLIKSYSHVPLAIKQVQELATSRFQKQFSVKKSTPTQVDFSLKNLLLEPLRHIARETGLLRQLQDLFISSPSFSKLKSKNSAPKGVELPPPISETSSSPVSDTGSRPRPSHAPPSIPGQTPSQDPTNLPAHPKTPQSIIRRPSLPVRPNAPQPPDTKSGISPSGNQLAWYSPYQTISSSVESLDETLSYMSGLLDRVCKNFNFVDASEILSATMDERGFPQISGGSIEALVKRLTHHSFTDFEFVDAFLLTYRMFISPIQFLNMMIQRFNSPFPPNLDDIDKEAYTKNVREPIQNRVVQVILQWIQSPLSAYDFQPSKIASTGAIGGPMELDTNQKALHTALISFCENTLMKEDPFNKDPPFKPHGLMITSLLKIATKSSNSLLESSNQKIIMVGPAASGATANNQLSPVPSTISETPTETIDSIVYFEEQIKAIANTIIYYDYKSYREIFAKDFLGQKWTKPDFEKLAPGIHSLTTRFNRISQWACYEVVNPELQKTRTQAITTLLLVAQELLEMRDFSGCIAILSGLNSSAASRLKKSFKKVSTKIEVLYENLTELASGKENYRIARALWTSAQPPAVPFLAITLKDLTFIEDGNPDKLDDGSTNFYKFRKMAEVISSCLSKRDIHTSFKPDPNIDSYFKSVFAIIKDHSEDSLYKISKKRE